MLEINTERVVNQLDVVLKCVRNKTGYVLTLQGDKTAFKITTIKITLETIFDFSDLFHPLILKLERSQDQDEGMVPTVYSFWEDKR